MSALTARTVTLTLQREDLWTLHHVLLERLEAEQTSPEPGAIDPPPLAVCRVFDTLEAGRTRVRIADLETVTKVLRHDGACPPWCLDCDRLAALCNQLTELCEQHHHPQTIGAADD